jgi:hypothetical protein
MKLFVILPACLLLGAFTSRFDMSLDSRQAPCPLEGEGRLLLEEGESEGQAECYNRATNCASYTSLCNKPYFALCMQRHCAATCGFC